MPYRFAPKDDYTDYAGGRVFYSVPGHPALPVRLVCEIFQRCWQHWSAVGQTRCILYDPCCGGAYHLSVLAHLNWPHIGQIVASDVDGEALSLAKRNLSLLTPAGLARRMRELKQLWTLYHKPSHEDAWQSAARLYTRLEASVQQHPITFRVFEADATNGRLLSRQLNGRSIDIILTDIPYGAQSTWQTEKKAGPPVAQMLEALLAVLQPQAVVAITADKGQKITHDAYQRLERFQIGKRQVAILRPHHL